MKISTETIKGKSFEIHLNESGEFFCVVDGVQKKADTLAGLKEKLLATMRKASVKVAIPVVWWNSDRQRYTVNGGKIDRGAFTGIHASNDNLLLRTESGKTEQLSAWGCRGKYFPPEREARLVELSKAYDAAKYALDDFAEKFAYNIREEIKKLVEKAGGAS